MLSGEYLGAHRPRCWTTIDAVEQMGGPEQMIVGSLISLEGDVQGMILFLLQKNFSSMMIKTLLCEEESP